MKPMRRLVVLVLLAAFPLPAEDPPFWFGAVYFRKSNPPEKDWERDHRTAAAAGMNIMRHWFMWSAIEVAPGKYDWRDYDRMLDLEAKNNIRTVIAEMITSAPEWTYNAFPQARYETIDGRQMASTMSPSSATGGPRLCLDNDAFRAKAEEFLKALAGRYKDHPAMYGYDLWNECNLTPCYCPSTARKFREWLKKRYGTLEALGKVWHRYSFADWENIDPPRSAGPHPDWIDWARFREDNAFEQMRWRREAIRSVDAKNHITAHGIAATLHNLPGSSTNDWRAAAEVESYGFTWVVARHGNAPWQQFQAVDLVRGAARGKPFWHSEQQGGPLWMQPQVIGHPIEGGRKPDAKDVRVWNMTSFATGVSGLFYVRWRPLLDGPLFGAFGPYGMDGGATPRSEMAATMARWTLAHAEIWKSKPVRGDIAIVFVPESERFNYAQQGDTNFYNQSASGAYMAFFDSNIQADYVHIDNIAEYPVVYLPYPVALSEESVAKLRRYVELGGHLISEGLPAYFNEYGHASETQPGAGLDTVFGAREVDVEFTPDLLDDLRFRAGGHAVRGRIFRQVYRTEGGGTAAGTYDNGSVAAVEHAFGKGRTLLVGTFPGAAYYRKGDEGSREFFRGLLEWAKRPQQAIVSDDTLKARLHEGPGGTYLWVINPNRVEKTVSVTLSKGSWKAARRLWGEGASGVQGRTVKVRLDERDAAVLRLE
jgi:beta-galactosidase